MIIDPQRDLVSTNLGALEKALRLFENATGLVTSLYLPDGRRLLGPFTTTPFGELLRSSGVFAQNQLAFRAEQEELIPILATRERRQKNFAGALTTLGVPVVAQGKTLAVVFTGWVFDHFPDPIECDRLARLFGIDGVTFWQTARTQSPVGQEKLRIYEEMLTLILGTMSDQFVALRSYQDASRVREDFLGLVSHELRTPLTTLLLRVQMLKSGRVPKERMDQFLSSLEGSALLQTQLVEDLLEAARISSGNFALEFQETDLRRLVQESTEFLAPEIDEKNLRVDVEATGGDFRFVGDHRRLRLGITSVLTDAIARSAPADTIAVNLERHQSSITLSVVDHGSQTESPDLETGPGLMVVRRIIELHGGFVEVLETSGQKKVSLSLPLAPQAGTSRTELAEG